jgi:hypothetical protein
MEKDLPLRKVKDEALSVDLALFCKKERGVNKKNCG